MQLNEFNKEGAVPAYGYERSPVNHRAFLIMKKDDQANNIEPVGDYTVLDQDEDESLSEKKVMNLITLLNGRKQLMELGHETNTRVLYNVIHDGKGEEETTVMFYKLEAEGVSKESALLRFKDEKGVL
ncbi:MAG: hypothetical protein AAF549_02145 [Pseudomonadota bacterium]